MDDADSRAEDHVGDETRCCLLTKEHTAGVDLSHSYNSTVSLVGS